MPMPIRLRRAVLPALMLVVALLAGCKAAEDAPPRLQPAATPEAAVRRLLDDLRRDDLAAYAVHAVPPDLYARTDAAWRAGRSRWPVSELPLSEQMPRAIDRLSTPGAETALRATYRKQFAGADDEVRTAVRTLGLFSRQYLVREADIPRDELSHRLQVLDAVVDWASRAPLADASRVEPLIPALAGAARGTRLAGGEAAWSNAGMHRSLVRLRPLLRQAKHSLAALGLDVDAALDGARIETISHTGDRARMRLRYPLAGRQIIAELDLQRRAEGWFLLDSMRHAQAALTAAPGPGGVQGGVRHNAADGPADPTALPGRPGTR